MNDSCVGALLPPNAAATKQRSQARKTQSGKGYENMENLISKINLAFTIYFAIDDSPLAPRGCTLISKIRQEQCQNYDLISDSQAFNKYIDESRNSIAKMAAVDISNVRVISKQEYNFYNSEDVDEDEDEDF